MGRKAAISERLLAQVWQQQLAGREALVTTSGDTVEVLHPGRPTNDCGPDFRDALIAVNGHPPLQGDIELHVNARDWQTHGHHRDPNYDRVVLHVAMQSDGMTASPLHNGRSAPVLTLSESLGGSTEEIRRQLCQPPFGEEPCYQAFIRFSLGRILEEAGEERFRIKAQRFETALAGQNADQVLYQGLMRAMGYSKNKEPFEKLARLLPLSDLERPAKRGDAAEIQALMLGTAGLLPSQRSTWSCDRQASDEPEAEELERIWSSSAHAKAMEATEWRFFGIRPENSPTRRLVAAGHLLARHRGGLLPGILSAMNRLSLTEIQDSLEESLMVKAEGYWACHFDFGTATGQHPSLIGRGRARDIIVNVVLPFCLGWSCLSGQDWLSDLSESLYHSHPMLNENWITRHMKAKALGDDGARLDSACQQQGLIRLHEAFCAGHRCRDCPLGGGHAAGHSQAAGASDLLDAKGAQQPEK